MLNVRIRLFFYKNVSLKILVILKTISIGCLDKYLMKVKTIVKNHLILTCINRFYNFVFF